MSKTVRWQCPMCQRAFRVPVGREWELCPDCEQESKQLLRWKAFDDPHIGAALEADLALDITVVTSETLEKPGFRIAEHLPVITTRYVAGVGLFSDIAAGLRDIFGGRSETLEKVLAEIEAEMVRSLQQEALRRKAQAVVHAQFQFGELSGGGALMIWGTAQGTPVRLAPDDADE